jgi:hypothetical protein
VTGWTTRIPLSGAGRYRRYAVRLERQGNRRAADTIPDIREGSLDPCVTPGGILLRHPHDQATDFGEETVAGGGTVVRVRPLPLYELPMPSQNRAWCDDTPDLTQDLPSQPMPVLRKNSKRSNSRESLTRPIRSDRGAPCADSGVAWARFCFT